MARSKKGKRSIIVDTQKYSWSTTGSDAGITLVITEYQDSLSTVIASFCYHPIIIKRDPKTGSVTTKQSFIITPAIVREVILYALKNGWKPKQRAPQMTLGYLDDKINLNLKPE